MAVKYKMDEDARDQLDRRIRWGTDAIKSDPDYGMNEDETTARYVVSNILTALFGPAGYCVDDDSAGHSYSVVLDPEREQLARTFLGMCQESWEGDAEDYTATLVTVDNPLLPKDEEPNEPMIVRVPGHGDRTIIDTTYEVRLGDTVLRKYSSAREADNFLDGYLARK